MKVSGVYVIESPAGMYVGSSINVVRREQQHFLALRAGKHYNRRLQRAYDRHGDLLKMRVLLVCKPSDLLLFEQRAINCMGPTYNLCPVAGNSLGVRWSSESRTARSELLKGRPVSEETRSKLAAQAGWKHSEESKQKMRGKVRSSQHRSKIAEASAGNKNRLGAVISPEMRERISLKLRGRVISPDVRARMAAGQQRRARSAQPELNT